jgi:hypothetical protein
MGSNSWQLAGRSRGVNDPGDYVVFQVRDPETETRMTITVSNEANAREMRQFISSASQNDLNQYAAEGRRVGWSTPIIRKDVLAGIPVVFIRDERPLMNGSKIIVRVLEVDMFVGDKFFFIRFAYASADAASVNRILDSIRAGMNSAAISEIGDI